ncbi:hypothetical protein KUCAC02_011019, partial [Chaenocephalus aceratus]
KDPACPTLLTSQNNFRGVRVCRLTGGVEAIVTGDGRVRGCQGGWVSPGTTPVSPESRLADQSRQEAAPTFSQLSQGHT